MTLDEVRAEIAKMRADPDEPKTYQFIGDKYGVNKGIIHRILNKHYEPQDKDIRRKLGLEDLTIDFIRQVRNKKGTFTKGELK